MSRPEVDDWRKSSLSFSNGNCLEAATWREAAGTAGVLVRDTADRDGSVLAFPAGSWRAFLAALRG